MQAAFGICSTILVAFIHIIFKHLPPMEKCTQHSNETERKNQIISSCQRKNVDREKCVLYGIKTTNEIFKMESGECKTKQNAALTWV